MTISEPTVYIDFLCPWAYRGAMWLAEVEKAGRIRPQFRFFSLSQNHAAHEGHGQPPTAERSPRAQGLAAFLAARAPRTEGAELGDRFRLELQVPQPMAPLPADHDSTHRVAAQRAGLDV